MLLNRINKKGFTLIEMLAVILLIGVISLILIPSVVVIINKNKQKTCISTKESIISATKMYVAENKYTKISCGENNISVTDLKDYGNISDKELDNKFTNTNVKVTYNCDSKKFTYTYNVNCEN